MHRHITKEGIIELSEEEERYFSHDDIEEEEEMNSSEKKMQYVTLTKLEEKKIKSIRSDGKYIVTCDGNQVRVKLIDEHQPIYAKELPNPIQYIDINDGLLAISCTGVIVVVDLKTRKNIFAFKHERGPMLIMGLHVTSEYVALVLSNHHIELFPIHYNGVKTTNQDSKYYIYKKHDTTDFVMVGDETDDDLDDDEEDEERELNAVQTEFTERMGWNNNQEYTYTTKHFDAIEEHEDSIGKVILSAKVGYPCQIFHVPKLDLINEKRMVSLRSNVLVFPSPNNVGKIWVIVMKAPDHFDISKIKAHTSHVACLALSRRGNMLATSSEAGKVVRVFDLLKNNKRIQNFRRAHVWSSKEAMISIAFSFEDDFLSCISMTGTVHYFIINTEHELYKHVAKSRKDSKKFKKPSVINSLTSSISSYFNPSSCSNQDSEDGAIDIHSNTITLFNKDLENRKAPSMLSKFSTYFADEWSSWQYHVPKALFSDLSLVSLAFDATSGDCVYLFSPELGGMVQDVTFNLSYSSIREVNTYTGTHSSSLPSGLMIYLEEKPSNRVVGAVKKKIQAKHLPLTNHRFLVPDDIIFGQLIQMIRHELHIPDNVPITLYDANGQVLSPNFYLLTIYQTRSHLDSFLYIAYSVGLVPLSSSTNTP